MPDDPPPIDQLPESMFDHYVTKTRHTSPGRLETVPHRLKSQIFFAVGEGVDVDGNAVPIMTPMDVDGGRVGCAGAEGG